MSKTLIYKIVNIWFVACFVISVKFTNKYSSIPFWPRKWLCGGERGVSQMQAGVAVEEGIELGPCVP